MPIMINIVVRQVSTSRSSGTSRRLSLIEMEKNCSPGRGGSFCLKGVDDLALRHEPLPSDLGLSEFLGSGKVQQ
jgi:hypothetical protein